MDLRLRPGRRFGAAILALSVLLGAGCAALVTQEREHRAGMLIRHQDRREYWRRRIADADEALRHIEQLRKELQ